MDIQIATLCDFAADYNGKMVVSGTFDTLAAQALPVVHPMCTLAIRLCITPEDNGQHKFSVTLIDADGKAIDDKMPIVADMPVELPDSVPFMTRNLLLNLQGLRFPEDGFYSIDISIDDELEKRIPLRIVKVDQNQQQPA
ncbi:DUF6941 family protein [Persicirhabdus sediminis]|uniref:Uncharacterized protein n=1 Tax=Persicirhabdus sediminis TaxID=454144 RepID=A0A8J7MEL1_9BACT|nr:hypothetical protein [Persicirhabdus sediminis]MBK1791562.1 hypothetical protein [Persicirhabdus sediminis]